MTTPTKAPVEQWGKNAFSTVFLIITSSVAVIIFVE